MPIDAHGATVPGMASTKRTATRMTEDGRFQDDAWLRLKEAAVVVDVSYWTLSRWATRGEFCPKAVKLPNGQWRVQYRDLVEWMGSLRTR